MEKNKVTIVIPNYNGRDLILANLPKVIRAYKNKVNKIEEIIVVDDGSSDDSVKIIKNNFPEIRLIKHKVNRGFSSAVNTGVRHAKGNLVALLNSDVYPDPYFLQHSLKYFDDQKVFAVSFHTKGYSWVKGRFEDGFIVYEEAKEGTKTHETFFANAGGAVYSRQIWNKLNGMDEALFSPFYWEDVDISYRALKRGYRILWTAKSYVSENLSATINKLPRKKVRRIQERNQLLLIWKDVTSPDLIRKHVVGVLRRVLQHPGYIVIIVMALSKIRKVLKLRRKEMKQTKVSDEAVFARF